MKIEEATQTVGGDCVKIYAVLDDQVHGAIWVCGHWEVREWNLNGEIKSIELLSSFNLDLHDWRDDIPWSCLQDDIKWVFWDRKNGWRGCSHFSSAGGQDAIPCPQSDQYPFWFTWSFTYNLQGVKMPNPPSDWRQAIAKRPI